MSDVRKHAALLAVLVAMTGGLAGLSVIGAPSVGASVVMGGWGGCGSCDDDDDDDGDDDGDGDDDDDETDALEGDSDDVDRADDVGEDGDGFGSGTGLGTGTADGGTADDVDDTPVRSTVNGVEAVA